jgi:hypothetical protein
MRITPKSEQEIQNENLLPAGEYDFEIMDAEEAVSKAGNDMIKLKVKIFSDDHGERIVFDYLMESVAYKLRHAAEACGLLESYESGLLDAEDFKLKVGRCKVGVQKDKSGQFPDRNSVSDYLMSVPSGPSASKPPVRQRQMAHADLDDEVPF